MIRHQWRPIFGAKRVAALALICLIMSAFTGPLAAQNGAVGRAPTLEAGQSLLTLSAALGSAREPIRGGLQWRVYQERAQPDGTHALVAESADALTAFAIFDGAYVVHVSYGLASAMKRVSVEGKPRAERLEINAGMLRVKSLLGDAALAPNRVSLAVYVPDRSGSEARLIVSNAHPGDVLQLPEGNYRVVSTYLDKESAGSTGAPGAAPNATNSVVSAELRVDTGRLTEANLRHHAATLTLKLVNSPGSEALANTSFSVLTPGGDVIRELIGAFPALILAEGEYVVIARRDGKTFQKTFTVQSALDQDVEVIAQWSKPDRGRPCRPSSSRSNARLDAPMKWPAPLPRPRSPRKSTPSPETTTFSRNSTWRRTPISAISWARRCSRSLASWTPARSSPSRLFDRKAF